MKRLPTIMALLGTLATPACTESVLSTALPCDPTTPRGSDPREAASYARDGMLCIGLEMNDESFAELAGEHRFGDNETDSLDTVLTAITTDCGSPLPNRFTWYVADLETDGHTLQDVGVRKKGFLGSVAGEGEVRPSLKVKTDKFVEGQLLGDTERITLNNNIEDPSRIRTCLAFDVFAAAGYPTPRCNLANVVVNGQAMGAYSHVESMKKRFLRRVFGDDTGSLYEGTIADFTPEYFTGFPHGELGRWEAKTDDTDPSGAPLLRLMEALQVPDEELLDALEPVMNVDLFITFWALETLINHSDGYSGMRSNFYVYFDPRDGDRAVFLPWGVDQVFNDSYSGGVSDLGTFAFAELPRRFARNPALADRYERELRRLLDEVWNEEDILESIDAMAAQVRTAEDAEGHEGEVAELRDWVRGRRARLTLLLAEGIPEQPREPRSCFEFPSDMTEVATAPVGGLAALGLSCSSSGPPRTPGAPTVWLLLILVLRRRRPQKQITPDRT